MGDRSTLGIDRLLAEPERWLKGGRVALLSNQASVTSDHRPSATALQAALAGRLVALLTPEHGASGFEEDAASVPDGRDARTGLPVHSLYGPRRRPDPGLLREVDAVVVDLRDVGVRCYTYAASVALLLEVARETGTEVVVCDRPALLGSRLDGPALDPAGRSFLAYLDVPFQHGLTLGELMRLHARRLGGAPLRVLEVQGWRRGDADAGAFVPPSPGLPTPAAAALYPGLVALEGTELSEGRGTPLPFQLVGGPGVDGDALARDLNARGLQGVWARPLSFRPDSGKLGGRRCDGVQLHPTDMTRLRPLEVGAAALSALRSAGRLRWRRCEEMPWARHPDAGRSWHEPVEGWLVDALLGDASFRAVVEGEASFGDAAARWAQAHAAFLEEAAPELLYRPAPAAASASAPAAPRATGRKARRPAGAGGCGLGLDAGGSSTRWRLEDEGGVVAEGRLAPLARHLFDAAGRADASARLDELAEAVLPAVPEGLSAMVGGVAGLAEGSAEASWLASELAARLGLAPERVRVLDDIEVAYRGAFPDGHGVVVVAGTGAIAVTRGTHGRLRAGGHGYLIDDDGGGFSIGRAALRAVLREADRLGAPPGGPLARHLYQAIGASDWDGVRAYVYGGGRQAVARLVPAVRAAAVAGDVEAQAILRWAGDQLARLASLVLARVGEPRPVALTGGVARVGGPLETAFRDGLPAPVEARTVLDEPVVTAARLARALARARAR